MTPVYLTLAAVFGLLFGSFSNVLIYRIPAGANIAFPGSACGACGHPVRSYDNIPILSWLVLGAKCRDCKAPISWRYPVIEAAMALAWVGITYQRISLPTPDYWSLLGFLPLGFCSIVLAMIDIDVKRLPNSLTYLLAPLTFITLGVAGYMHGDLGQTLIRMVAGGLAYAGVLLFLAIIKPGGMGMGDVKLALTLGVALGYVSWGALVIGFLAAFLLGAVFSVLLIALTSMTRKNVIPFGPWLLVGMWVGIVWGDALFEAYLGLLGIR